MIPVSTHSTASALRRNLSRWRLLGIVSLIGIVNFSSLASADEPPPGPGRGPGSGPGAHRPGPGMMRGLGPRGAGSAGPNRNPAEMLKAARERMMSMSPEERSQLREKHKQGREARRQAKVAGMRSRMGEFLRSPQVQEELRVHSEHMARLHRMQALAEDNGKDALLDRIFGLMKREQERHMKVMTQLRAQTGSGSSPANASPPGYTPGGPPSSRPRAAPGSRPAPEQPAPEQPAPEQPAPEKAAP